MFMKMIWGPAVGLMVSTSFGIDLAIPAKSETLVGSVSQEETEIREEKRKIVINRHGRDFDDMDADGDGRLSLEEFQSGANSAEMFEKLDLDGNDYVTEEEIETYAQARVEEAMGRVRERLAEQGLWDEESDSVNVDAVVERHMKRAERAMERAEEAVRRSERIIEMRFQNMDEDGDGEITLDEMGVDTARIGRHLMMTELAMENRFEALDADEDGALSEEEFLSRRQELFRELDEDGDGFLSEDEMEAAIVERVRIRMPDMPHMRHMHRHHDHQEDGEEDNNNN